MADLSITAANVKWISGVRPQIAKGGAAITRGKAVRADTTGEMILAQANDTATSTVRGIAITDGNDGGDMLVAGPGAKINVGATTVAGTAYVLSAAAAGGIAPIGDLAATNMPNFLFWGSGTAEVTLVCEISPAAIPGM